MKAIVYMPTDEEALNRMQEQFAKIHAEVFMTHLNNLPVSYDEKIKILRELKAELPD